MIASIFQKSLLSKRKGAGFCSGARVMYAFGIFNPYGTLRTRIGVRCLDLIDNVESAVGFVFRKSRIADKEFYEKRFVLTGLRILRGKGMPPPIITVMSQGAVQHAGIPGDVVMIEHKMKCASSLLLLSVLLSGPVLR